MSEDLFERAQEEVSCRDVAERAGFKLLGRRGRFRGVCPLNRCGDNSGAMPFVVRPARVGLGDRYRCYSCNQGGDVVDLEHRLFGSGAEGMAAAALRLVGGEARQISDAERERRAQKRDREALEASESEEFALDLARRLWREGEPAGGTLAQTYLESRGLFGPVVARAVEILRFHPRAYHSGHPQFGVFLPAMVALVMTEFGPTGGVHVTYLRADGKAKANRKAPKKMWGPQGHRCWWRPLIGWASLRLADGPAVEGEEEVLLPGGIWLTRPDATGPLVVAEGIENALSRAWLKAGDLALPVRAAAAGSLDRLQGFELVDDDGCRDVHQVKGDLQRPPFTWPEDPAAPWGEVDIATDGDMSDNVRVLGRAGRKRRPVMFRRDGAERARVCGVLATEAWRRRLNPDSPTRVGWSRPPLGTDFNIELGRVQAAAKVQSEAAA